MPCARAFGSTIRCMGSSSSRRPDDSDGWPMMSTGNSAWRCQRRDTRKSGSQPSPPHGLMILTGWRRGEVLGLRWSEVDLPRRTAPLADTKTGASLRPLSELACAVIQSQPRIGDVVFASRSGETPIVGYRKMWLRIAKLGDLPTDITPDVLRHSFASFAADLGTASRLSPACSATRPTASPAGTSIPPTSCCWQQPTPWPMPP